MTRILSGAMSSTRRVVAARTHTRTPTTTAVGCTVIGWYPIDVVEVSADGVVVVVVDVTPAARVQTGITISLTETEMNTHITPAVAVEMIWSLTDQWASMKPSFSGGMLLRHGIFAVGIQNPITSAGHFLVIGWSLTDAGDGVDGSQGADGVDGVVMADLTRATRVRTGLRLSQMMRARKVTRQCRLLCSSSL